MVGFVEADGLDAGFLHRLNEVKAREVLAFACFLVAVVELQPVHRGVESLICDGGDERGSFEVEGNVAVRVLALGEEAALEALTPLLTDNYGGREHYGRLAQSADKLKPENGLAAAGSGDDVNAPVGEVAVGVLEDARLIIAEGAAETDIPEVFHGNTPWIKCCINHTKRPIYRIFCLFLTVYHKFTI